MIFRNYFLFACLIGSLLGANAGFVSLKQISQKIGINKLLGIQRTSPYIKEFDQIDRYLVENLPDNEDVAANLELAQKWLHQLSQENKWTTKKKLIKALGHFVALTRLNGDKLCIMSSREILETNDDATRDSVKRLRERGLKDAKRIEKIIYDYASRHINECPEKMKEKFNYVNSKIPEDLKQRTQELMEPLIASHIIYDHFEWPELNQTKSSLYDFIEHHPMETAWFVISTMSPIGTEKDLMLLYEYLDESSKGDIKNNALHQGDSDGDANYQSLERLFKTYLYETCFDYHNWFEAVFEPIEFDFVFVDEKRLLSESNPDELDFMQTLVFYEGCENFIDNKKSIKKNFMKYMEWCIHVRGFSNI